MGILAGILVLAVNQVIFWGFTCDDAYISFRYAANLVSGHGLVFNPGEAVEGYSNFLWTLLLGAMHLTGVGLVTTAKALGFLSAVGLVVYTGGLFVRLAGPSRSGVLVLGVLLGANTALGYHATSGMETGFLGFLLTAGAYHFIQADRRRHVPVALAFFTLASLTRPEGILFLAVPLGFWILTSIRERCMPARGEIVAAVTGVLVFAGVMVVRWLVYAELLPNTYYAKPQDWYGADPFPWGGLGSIAGFLIRNGALALPFAALLLIPRLDSARTRVAVTVAAIVMTAVLLTDRPWLDLLRWFLAAGGLICFLGFAWTRERKAGPVFVTAIVGCGLLFMLYANTDWMSLHRFLAPYLGLVLALVLAGIHRRRKQAGSGHLVSVALGAVLALVLAFQVTGSLRFRARAGGYPNLIMTSLNLDAIGRDLAGRWPPTTTLATKRVGAVAFYSGLVIHDLFGLVDKEIARIYHDDSGSRQSRQVKAARTVLARQPDLLLVYATVRMHNPGHPTPAELEAVTTPDCYLLAPALEAGYRFVKAYRSGDQEWAYLYQRPEKDDPLLGHRRGLTTRGRERIYCFGTANTKERNRHGHTIHSIGFLERFPAGGAFGRLGADRDAVGHGFGRQPEPGRGRRGQGGRADRHQRSHRRLHHRQRPRG